MTTKKETKLRTLFKNIRQGNVITIPLLESLNISDDLRMYYLESGWLEAIGRGAFKKPDDNIEWYGALSAIQEQIETKVHVGGLTALDLQGFSHYIRLSKETLYLFSPPKTRLPKWFIKFNWNVEILHKSTSFLPENIGTKKIEIKQINVIVSTPERAIMECLYLAPNKSDIVECYKLFEGLVNLKPKLVTELLQACTSVKVKRLFLYMAEKANHQWFQFLEIDNINLGRGRRMITEKGVYNSKYLISIPKDLAEL
ncbi:MAG: type IV toxin-antitoxin system AbiEi family antitoxin [Bacteroidales bacterium]|nr:type IV toxin-antitoxin system AbiEi family antitoxin [Bacteroidales bacterium]